MRNSLVIATLLVIATSLPSKYSFSQENVSLVNKLANLPNTFFSGINSKTADLDKQLEKQTEKVLKRLEKKEAALKDKLARKDSTKAQQLFSESANRYQALQAKLKQPIDKNIVNPLKEYIPRLDSLQTALRFLQQKNISLPTDKLQQFQMVSTELQQLQAKFQVANEVQTFIKQREQQLKEQLSSYHLESQLLGINKEVYYYQAQLTQYKNILNDPEKLQQTVLSVVRQLPLFQRFWQKNSYLATLFPTPDNAGTPLALAGLQTRDQLQKELQLKFGISKINLSGKDATGGSGYLNQQMQQVQTKLDALKNKISQFGGSSSMTMPDFKPNSQHGKTFLKRLQYDLGVQNNTSTYLLPSISTVSLNLGYKINDKAAAGIGANFLLGLGSGLNHIRLSCQGIGGKMFVDIKAKANIWITGGLEYNYMQAFSNIESIKNLDLWQKSILTGLTKKYRIGKKENKIQLLYDFLADREIPRGQSFKFRMGWGL